MKKTLPFCLLYVGRLLLKTGCYVILASILCLWVVQVNAQHISSDNLEQANIQNTFIAFNKGVAKPGVHSLSGVDSDKADHVNLLKERRVEGIVTDENGNPLAGVSVQIKGTNQGVTTNASGSFSLNVPDNAVLSISFVGYQTREVGVANKNNISIQLKAAASGLNEVVIVGYGKLRKKQTLQEL